MKKQLWLMLVLSMSLVSITYAQNETNEVTTDDGDGDEMAVEETNAVGENQEMKTEEAVPAAVVAPTPAPEAKAVDFGDFRSSTLISKAWEALNKSDIESVLAYTNKCIELFAEQARKFGAELKDYPTGSNDDIFKFWALNDVATAYYIQGEAYRKANMKDESKEAFNKLIKEYPYGQTWDIKGWFWKPAEAAKEKLAMLDVGVNIDFGDYSSSQLVQKSWAALASNDLNAVTSYVDKIIELYGAKAKEMQESLKEYPIDSKEKTMNYWALNDVGTALYIKGEAYRNAGKKEEAAQAYKKLIDEYFYAQCWDPQGWFWKPAEQAQQKLSELDNV